ncbi:MAG: hypothetical protein MK411_11580 [SAR202 cluster bacterium]|nr:hypothetical protein [SAR202 cluster bacterium]
MPITEDKEMDYQAGTGDFLGWFFGALDQEERDLIEEGKKVPTGADTRLITPYTSYLLRGFE